MPILGAALGDASGKVATNIFVGPKAINVLKSIHASNPKITLASDLEFGFWGFIGKYLFLALQFLHSHVASNWGWDIIILTILINVAHPAFARHHDAATPSRCSAFSRSSTPSRPSTRSPKMNDPKCNQMNAGDHGLPEVAGRQHVRRLHSAAHHLPADLRLLRHDLPRRGAAPRPLVLAARPAGRRSVPTSWPILTVIFQFAMQFYTPSPGVDKQQQKMMAFMMPLITGYFTWNYASGLALYWVVGIIVGIVQQMVMNRTSLGKEMHEIAAKRARRKSGSAQTIQGKR